MSIQSQKRNELLQRGKALTLKSLILECNIRGHNPTDQRGIKRNQMNYSKVALKGTKILQYLRSWPSGKRDLFPSSAFGFDPLYACLLPPRCLICHLGLQGVQSVRELVVMRVSWLGHPGLKKKYPTVFFF
jgi:hypothetical protein